MNFENLLNELAEQFFAQGNITRIRKLRNPAKQYLKETKVDTERLEEHAATPPVVAKSEITEPYAAKQIEHSPKAMLQGIRERCELKSEAAYWAAKRIRLLADRRNFANEIEPHDIAIIKKAKSLDCYLWMCSDSGPVPSNPTQYEVVGECFQIVAEDIQLMELVLNNPGASKHEFKVALDLLAEAQSALRVSVENIGGPVDSDQDEIFYWLRGIANQHQIYLERHMRLEDPATASGKEILGRIARIKSQVQENQRRENEKKRLLGKVRHKTKQILNDPKGSHEIWGGLIDCIVDLVSGGMPSSNIELRDLLLPVVEYLPDLEAVPKEFELVMRELDQFTVASDVTDDLQFAAQPSREVAEVAKLLKGKSVVIIGGINRRAAIDAIRNAFGLKEVKLIETTSHESYENFIPSVSRPDVNLVMLAVRWASHSFKEIEKVCEALGKPLIRLPSGYNPNQIAAQILAQASKRLGGS